jgi:Tfp pilus assembly protein PilW
MIAGILVTLLLGVGLMSLLFLSSRRGYDKPADQVENGESDRPAAADRKPERDES